MYMYIHVYIILYYTCIYTKLVLVSDLSVVYQGKGFSREIGIYICVDRSHVYSELSLQMSI